MKFYKCLYIGDTVKNPSKIKRRLKLHAGVSVHIIAFAPGNDQLEIYHSAFLKQSYYRKHPPVIIGLAGSHDEAVEIVVKITKECLLATGNCNLKEYLKERAKQGNK